LAVVAIALHKPLPASAILKLNIPAFYAEVSAMEDTINTIEESCENTEAIALAKAIQIQDKINQHLKQLSLERLQVVADFVAYLADKESEEATQELEKIPGFVESFEKGKKDISEGRITPLEQLKRKY
jgi:hypothetical protein